MRSGIYPYRATFGFFRKLFLSFFLQHRDNKGSQSQCRELTKLKNDLIMREGRQGDL